MNKHTFSRMYEYLWSLFLNGLLLLLPVTITFSIFSLMFKFIKGWLAPLKELHIPFVDLIPHGEVFLVLAVILGAGLFVRTFLLAAIMDMVERILSSVPLVRPVYTNVKQLIHAFSPQDDTIKKVVFIEFPRKGIYSIGFLTSELYRQCSPDKSQALYNIFVPTTPNPTTGYFVAVPEKDFIVTELTNQEAMALIISGGIIQPERFKN